jgi:DNA-binding NarL/FixJ family response regulator
MAAMTSGGGTRRKSGARGEIAFERLTTREGENVNLVCEGLGNKAIAARLEISEATVRHHLTSIFAKLGLRDRVALVIAHFRRRDASPGK